MFFHSLLVLIAIGNICMQQEQFGEHKRERDAGGRAQGKREAWTGAETLSSELGALGTL